MLSNGDVYSKNIIVRDLEYPIHLSEDELAHIGQLYFEHRVYERYTFIWWHFSEGRSMRGLETIFGVSGNVIQRWFRFDPILMYLSDKYNTHKRGDE